MKKIILSLFAFSICISVIAGSNSSVASFLKLGSSSRISAVGDSGVAFPVGPDSITLNPGLIVMEKNGVISFNHMSYFESSSYDTLFYSKSLSENSAFAVGLQYFSYGSLNETDSSGSKIGSYSPSDMAILFGYSFKVKSKYLLLNNAGIGFSVKYINLKIKESASSFAIDFGYVSQIIFDKLRWGVSFQNIGLKIKFDEKKEKLPFILKTGINYKLNKNIYSFCDFSLPSDSDFYFSLGMEYKKRIGTSDVFLRAGYNDLRSDINGFSGFSLGTGIIFKKFSLDYTLLPYGELGVSHRFGISFIF